MATFVVLRHPVTILATDFTNPTILSVHNTAHRHPRQTHTHLAKPKSQTYALSICNGFSSKNSALITILFSYLCLLNAIIGHKLNVKLKDQNSVKRSFSKTHLIIFTALLLAYFTLPQSTVYMHCPLRPVKLCQETIQPNIL